MRNPGFFNGDEPDAPKLVFETRAGTDAAPWEGALPPGDPEGPGHTATVNLRHVQGFRTRAL